MTAFGYQNLPILLVGLPRFKRTAQTGGRAYQRSRKVHAAFVVGSVASNAQQQKSALLAPPPYR
jgi:hypothetical protein